VKDKMDVVIRPAAEADIEGILAIVNDYAAQNLMLPRSPEQIERVLSHFLVAEHDSRIVGCGSLVRLTAQLTELRSLAVDAGWRNTGLGRRLVEALVEEARQLGVEQLCALTLVEGFFNKLGFVTVDRWTISPKIWHECIYCPKFDACDEIAVLMNLTEPEAATQPRPESEGLSWPQLRPGTAATWLGASGGPPA
jgi:amino-acid N-acetyltransferase